MLNFKDFFTACAGLWKTERTYHFVEQGQIERSYTEFRVESLSSDQIQQILSVSSLGEIEIDLSQVQSGDKPCPGFAIAFDTRSETGEEVSMSLKALFVPDSYISTNSGSKPTLPSASVIPTTEEAIQGYYLRDEGYSEGGAIAGRFTYLSSRQTLEMTTFYRRSVAVDQMRFVSPNLRMRTIVTYKRPDSPTETPTVIDLIGFGVEHREALGAGKL